MRGNTRKTLFIIYLVVYSCFATQVNYHFDSEKGIITYEEGEVFLYEYMIYIPIIVTLPTSIKISDNGCLNRELLHHRLLESLDALSKRIPDDKLLRNITSNHRGSLTPQNISMTHGYVAPQRGSPQDKIMPIPELNPPLVRHKRFIVELALGILALLAISAAAGAITGSIALAKINMIKENQQLLAAKVNEQTDAINRLDINQLSIISMVKNISSKVNEIISTQNCHTKNTAEQLSFIVSWASVIPSSFMRALNAILSDTVNSDVIPGEYLQEIISCYPAFSNTIFEDNPLMIYKSSAIKIGTVSKYPPQVTGLMAIPRILKKPLGTRVRQLSCSWRANNVTYTIKEDSSAIRSYQSGYLYELESCDTKGDVTLCSQKKLKQYTTGCIGSGLRWDAKNCPVARVLTPLKQQIIQTPYGIVVCNPNTTVTSFRRDDMGIIRTRVETISTPKFFTSKEVESILIGEDHYPLSMQQQELIVTNIVIDHQYPDNIPQIDPIIDRMNITKITPLDNLVLQTTGHWYLTAILVAIISLVILFLIYLYKRNRVEREKQRKHLGYLNSQVVALQSLKKDDNLLEL